MTFWSTICGSASVAGLSLLFALHGLSWASVGILALGGVSIWATRKSPSSGFQLVLIVGLSAIGALYGLPTLELVVIVVLALMSHEFSQTSARYQYIPDVDEKLAALQRRQVLGLGTLACASGVVGLAWHVQVGFWWSLALALVLIAVFAFMIKQSA